MIDRAAFIERIAAAVFVGRRKYSMRYPDRRPWKGDSYEWVSAGAYAEDVARKLPGLFRTERIGIG